jgi:MoaA/NifB/PqqE/SkfB family radical SAM enzyme
MPDPSLTEIKKMLDRLSDGGLRRVCVTGGEPLLRSDLVSILRYAKKKNFNVTLSTNGWLLNAKLIKLIKPYVDNMRFSIRGLESEHDKIAGKKGSFEQTIRSVGLVRDIGLPISVVYTVVTNSFADMGKIARLCEDLKVDKLYFFSLIPRGRAIDLYSKLNVSIDKLTREYNLIMERVRKDRWNLDIKVANFTIDGECVLVFPNGDVVAVPSFTDDGNQKVLGNILKNSVEELWGRFPYKENHTYYYRNH